MIIHYIFILLLINLTVGRAFFHSSRFPIFKSFCLHGGLNLNEIYTNDEGVFKSAITRFDYANSFDPNQEYDENGDLLPRELLYSRRLYSMVQHLTANNASVPLRLAARSQHIMRWKIPRDSYPMDKKGYLTWRSNLKKFHATQSSQILLEVGYDKLTIENVEHLILKKNFPADNDSRILEDALCLVFLKYQLSSFSQKTEDDKTINALRKSWEKMSEQGRTEALKLTYDARSSELIGKALAGS